MKNETLKNRIHLLLEQQNSDGLKKLLEDLHPSVAAEAVQSLPVFDATILLERLDPRLRADLFGFLPIEAQLPIVRELPEQTLVELFTFLSHDERADLIQEFPEEQKEHLLRKLAQKERDDIRKLESYDEGTIGAIMTSDYVSLPPDITARDALDKLRQFAPDAETIYYAYVLDTDRHLKGIVTLKELILARPESVIREFMRTEVIHLRTRRPVEEAVQVLNRSDLLALPVLDRNEKMVGIVTHDDISDVATEEATDDFHRMAAAPGLKVMSLRHASYGQLLIKRLPWLLVLVFMNVFSGAGIAYFEDTIEAMIALVFFLPLLIDSGGNAGSQSATLMVRALAIGDVRLRDWFYFLRREILISISMGIVMGIGVASIAAFRAPEVMLVVSMTMTCTVVVGSLIGMLLPFVLTRLKFDPATASAPLITSLADISGVIIYFSIATWWLGMGA